MDKKKIYWFEILGEVARNGDNVVYDATDTASNTKVKLYEWAPPAAELSHAKEIFDHLVLEHNLEKLPAESHLYFVVPQAAPDSAAAKALGLLRQHQLFLGDWPRLSVPTDANPDLLDKKTHPAMTLPGEEEPIPDKTGDSSNQADELNDSDTTSGHNSRNPTARIVLSMAPLFALVIVFSIYLRPRTEGLLRIGVYKSFCPAVKDASAKAKMSFKSIPDLTKQLTENEPPHFDLLLLPLAALPDFEDDLKGWVVVWASEPSGDQLFKRRLASPGPIVSEEHTFGSYLVQRYLDQKCEESRQTALTPGSPECDEWQRYKAPRDSQEIIRREVDEGSNESSNESSNSIWMVAVHEPLATHLINTGWDVVAVPPEWLRAGKDIILARPGLMNSPEAQDQLVTFINHLRRGHEKLGKNWNGSLPTLREGIKDLLGNIHVENQELTEIMHSQQNVKDDSNLRFLIDLDNEGCTESMRGLDRPGLCRKLIDDDLVYTLVRKLRASGEFKAGYDLDELSDEDRHNICETDRHVKRVGKISGFERHQHTLTGQMTQEIRQWEVPPVAWYCVVGFGDADGTTDDKNREEGLLRADAVADVLRRCRDCGQPRKLITIGVALRREGQMGGDYRHVELRKIDLP